jgi:NADPH:quinone reductase-like Zn-dependent oxidoreductase
MRAILMTAVGGPEVLRLGELPDPQRTAEHDVRVRLRAAAIEPVDRKLRGVAFPLEQAADAHRALEAGEIVGKAVLTFE